MYIRFKDSVSKVLQSCIITVLETTGLGVYELCFAVDLLHVIILWRESIFCVILGVVMTYKITSQLL